MGIKCLTNCLGGFNLKLAVNLYWRALVTKKIDKIIAPSSHIKREALLNGIPAGKVEVIPQFTMKNSGGRRREPEEGIVLFIGRADALKGIGEFITALSSLEGKWRAVVVASGEEEKIAQYKEMARGLGLAGKIEFLGGLRYEALDRYYEEAAVVVFPSMSFESFGLVGIEAMSFGRPVVAFDSGGPAEWLRDGETGFLLRRGDVKGLASSINTLLSDKALARKMGERALGEVKAFRRGAHVKQMMTLYEAAIAGRAHGQ